MGFGPNSLTVKPMFFLICKFNFIYYGIWANQFSPKSELADEQNGKKIFKKLTSTHSVIHSLIHFFIIILVGGLRIFIISLRIRKSLGGNAYEYQSSKSIKSYF